MELTNIELRHETEHKIRELCPLLLSSADLEWFTDWVIVMGLGFIKHALAHDSNLTLGQLILMTTKNHDDFIN